MQQYSPNSADFNNYFTVDANGNWVSGQYKAHETGKFAEDINIAYIPSSVRVKQASLQIYSTANSQAAAFVDSSYWYQMTTDSTAHINLITDGAFDNPFASGWSTDNSSAVKRDTLNHGSPANPINSIALTLASGNAHLFSPKIGVDATKSYYIENYLNLTANNGGEVGMYIDEYDSAGNWISGQYKVTRTALGVSDINTSYTPSSASVNKVQLQYIFTAGSGLNGYIDNASMLQS